MNETGISRQTELLRKLNDNRCIPNGFRTFSGDSREVGETGQTFIGYDLFMANISLSSPLNI